MEGGERPAARAQPPAASRLGGSAPRCGTRHLRDPRPGHAKRRGLDRHPSSWSDRGRRSGRVMESAGAREDIRPAGDCPHPSGERACAMDRGTQRGRARRLATSRASRAETRRHKSDRRGNRRRARWRGAHARGARCRGRSPRRAVGGRAEVPGLRWRVERVAVRHRRRRQRRPAVLRPE